MMSRLGADVDELEAIAGELQGFARRISGARAGIDAELARTRWDGPDADAFRRRWRTTSVRDLEGFHAELDGAATELRRQATQQRLASAGGPGNAAGLLVARGIPLGLAGLGAASAAAGSRDAAAGADPSWSDVVGPLAQRGALAAGALIPGLGNTMLVGGVVVRHIAQDPAGFASTAAEGLLDLGTQGGALSRFASPGFLGGAAKSLSIGGMVIAGSAAAVDGYYSQRSRDLDRSDLSDRERQIRATQAAGYEAAITTGVVLGGKAVGAGVGTFLFGPGVGTVVGGAVGGAVGGFVADQVLDDPGTQVLLQGHIEVGTTLRRNAIELARDPSALLNDPLGTVGGIADEVGGVMYETGTEFLEIRRDQMVGAVHEATALADAAGEAVGDTIGGAVDTLKGWF